MNTALKGEINLKRKQYLAEIAIMTAFSFILSYFKFFHMPQGGSVSFATLPLLVIAFRRGLFAGIYAGTIVGALQMMNAAFIHPASLVLDYILAYGSIGLAGLFKIRKGSSEPKAFFSLLAGSTLGCAAKLLFHTLSGAMIFDNYTPIGQNKWEFSIIYNTTYNAPEFIFSLVFIFIIYKCKKSIFLTDNNLEY